MKIRINAPYVFLFATLAVLVGLHAWAAVAGLQAPTCPGEPNCYPWGAEGPAAGRWRYENKENYALINCAQAAVLVGWGTIMAKKIGSLHDGSWQRPALWILITAWAGLFFL
jgi:hypothetical protein